MLQVLINLLTPIFEGMGVSAVDVETYVNNLSGYIYAILGTLVLAIVVIVAAQFVIKKGTRHIVAINAALAWVLITTIMANVICFGPMYNNLAPILNSTGKVSEGSAAASEAVIEKVGDEGIVLAQNDGLLPLSGTTKINVFGWASTNPIYGGTGSGSSSNEGNIDMFITATADFALRGYEVSAVDYILKPLSYETDFKYKFDRVVKKANVMKQHSKKLVLKDDQGRFIKLDVSDLIYVIKERDNALYHTKQGVFSERTSIAKVKGSLHGEPSFADVNSGCLVNMAFIDNIDGNLIELFNGERLVLSRSKKKAFYERFFAYMDN